MRGLEKNDMGRGQINTQTHGHVDSMTNSAQRAELVKRSSFAILLPNIETMDIGHWKFKQIVNAQSFENENKSTQGYLVTPFHVYLF